MIIFVSCTGKQNDSSKNSNEKDSTVVENKDQQNDKDVVDWKRDSCGCLDLRDIQMLERIIDHHQLVGKDTTTIIEFLGNPNEVIKNDGEINFKYFLGSKCIGNNPNYSTDKSWIYLKFNNNLKLVGKPEEVAME